MYFELNREQTYSTCYTYFQGTGIGTTFTEDYSDNAYMNSTTLNVDNYFRQVEMTGASGSYSNGEYISKQLSTLTSSLNYLTLTAAGSADSGASITYYLSLDNGTTWTVTTSGTRLYLENGGTQPAYKFVMTSNAAKTANAYVTGITVEDLGAYASNITVLINGTTYNYTSTFDTDTGLFRANFGCTDINSYLSDCTDLTCNVPVNISFVGPGTITATQFYFGGTLSTVILNNEVVKKHQTNSKTSLTAVTVTVENLIGDNVTNNISFPEYSVASDLTLNITGEYWR